MAHVFMAFTSRFESNEPVKPEMPTLLRKQAYQLEPNEVLAVQEVYQNYHRGVVEWTFDVQEARRMRANAKQEFREALASDYNEEYGSPREIYIWERASDKGSNLREIEEAYEEFSDVPKT